MDKAKLKRWGRFILKRLVIYSILLVTIPLFAGYIFMEHLLLPEVKSPEAAGNMKLLSGKFELDVFYHPPQPGKPVILYSHGNAETLASIRPLLQEFISCGYGVLAYDYAGYGFSGGKASEKQVYCDVGSVYDFLTAVKKIPPQEIVVMGFSVGSGASCFIARKHPEIKALVLIAPFASAVEVMLPFALPGNRFNNRKCLQNIMLPVLIFHGDNDRIIPLRNSRKLYQTALGRKKLVVVKGAGHNDIFAFAGAGFFRELSNFTGE